MQDHSANDRINPVKGALLYSNIVTTVSSTYAQEVRTSQGKFEELMNHFKGHLNVRLMLKYDEVLSNPISAASNMFIMHSVFVPYGLTEMIAMRFGSVPIVRKLAGDCVFDVDDDTVDTIMLQFYNGVTVLSLDEQGVNCSLDRAFNIYMKNNESWWQQPVKRNAEI